jgi:hypothetical protein
MVQFFKQARNSVFIFEIIEPLQFTFGIQANDKEFASSFGIKTAAYFISKKLIGSIYRENASTSDDMLSVLLMSLK